MLKIIIATLTLLTLFSGCQESKHISLDGKKLLNEKCASCHNINLPPKTFTNEVAPPMMAVSFHIMDFIKVSNESERVIKSVAFVKDYVVNPSRSKSFCDKKSLEDYGVMPSQKGKVTQDELEAIAKYMFKHFTVKNLTEAQAIENRYMKMPKGKRLALKYNCLGCHKVKKDLVGPSFEKISQHYKGEKFHLKESIQNGSKGKWKDFKGAMMPAFKNKMSDEEIDSVVTWIEK